MREASRGFCWSRVIRNPVIVQSHQLTATARGLVIAGQEGCVADAQVSLVTARDWYWNPRLQGSSGVGCVGAQEGVGGAVGVIVGYRPVTIRLAELRILFIY
jgi:hypothetical protein